MKILVIEDETKLAGFIKKGLEEQSWEVEVAYDGRIGKSLAMSNTYDMIVMDVNLPVINGFDLVLTAQAGGMPGAGTDAHGAGYRR